MEETIEYLVHRCSRNGDHSTPDFPTRKITQRRGVAVARANCKAGVPAPPRVSFAPHGYPFWLRYWMNCIDVCHRPATSRAEPLVQFHFTTSASYLRSAGVTSRNWKNRLYLIIMQWACCTKSEQWNGTSRLAFDLHLQRLLYTVLDILGTRESAWPKSAVSTGCGSEHAPPTLNLRLGILTLRCWGAIDTTAKHKASILHYISITWMREA